MNVTFDNVEAVLDAGELFCAMNTGRWWKVRRNGATKRWKTRPKDIRIPIKFGFKQTAWLTDEHFNEDGSIKTGFFNHRDNLAASVRAGS